MGILYKLTFSSGKSYIGITIGSAKGRFKAHKAAAENNSQCAVHRAWRKYGAPKLQILATMQNTLLKKAEQNAIIKFDALGDGYNMTPGGESNPMHNPEIAARVSASLKGRPKTEQHKANLSKSKIGTRLPKKTRLKMSRWQRGRKLTPEHSANIAKALRENKEWVANCRKLCKKMAAMQTGKPHSEEHKAKISKSLKRHYASKTL